MLVTLLALGSMLPVNFSAPSAGFGGDNPLKDYLELPQPEMPPLKVTQRGAIYDIEFSSQKWHDTIWTHRILFLVPKGSEKSKTAILFITGDGPRNGDYVDLNLFAAATGMPVALLFNIPNQPLFGMKEDDLIAHTFEKYIETGDATWPLLFPMTKAAVRSMDIVERIAQNNGLGVSQFVVTGASKRGWTTWMVGASQDKRVKGIAPMVFDNLKFDAQMKRQLAYWGKYSEQIEDYTRRGLQSKFETESGKRLMQMVDPFFYRKLITAPTLIVNGTNDPYWTVDSHQEYWNELKQPKWLLEVPNAGHGLEDRIRVVSTVGAFAKSVDGLFKFPQLKAKLVVSKDLSEFGFTVDPGASTSDIVIWSATSAERDFKQAKWTQQRMEGRKSASMPAMPENWTAAFVEARYEIKGVKFTLSTPVELFKPR